MKAGLRAELLARRAALAPEARRVQSRAIADRTQALPAFRSARHVLGFWPRADEVDVRELLEAAAASRKRVALPRVDGSHLRFHAWRPGDPLRPSGLGIQEPEPTTERVEPREIDLVLVPGVGFDRRGHRLGFGRGYYDRALNAMPWAIRVGVAFDIQLVERVPDEALDVPMHWVLTASATHAAKSDDT